jgi:hypothetical protein
LCFLRQAELDAEMDEYWMGSDKGKEKLDAGAWGEHNTCAASPDARVLLQNLLQCQLPVIIMLCSIARLPAELDDYWTNKGKEWQGVARSV